MNLEMTESENEPPVKKPKHSRDLKAVLTTVVSGFGIMLLNASTGILTARTLKPNGRGELAAMVLWPVFLTFVTTLGVPSALIYMLKRYPEDRAEHISAGFLMTAALGVLAAILGAIFLPFWLHREYSPTIILYAQIFLLTTPLLALIQAARAAFEAHGMFSASNRVALLNPAATLCGLLTLLAVHKLTPINAAFAYTVAAVPTFFYTAVKAWPLFQGRWGFRVDTCRLLLSYGVRSYGIDLLGTLALQLDQVLVISMLSAANMGVYGVLLSLSRMFNVFQGSIVTVLFPKASGSSLEDVFEMVGRSARIGTMITAICSLAVSLVGSRVLTLLYGREYANNDRCLQILLVEVTISGCVFILAQAFMALGRPGVVSMLQAVGLGLSIPLMLVLVPRFGIMGAATSLLISTIARLLFVLWGFRFLLKLPFPRLLPKREDIKTLVALLPKVARAG